MSAVPKSEEPTIQLTKDVIDEARQGTASEQTMTLREAFRLYPKAIGWSMLLSTAIVMEGYDVVLLGSFFGYPSFNERYGTLQPDGKYVISAPWQTGLSDGALVGELIGLWLNGIFSERIGYRKTMIISLLAMIGFIFFPFFSPSLPVFLVGEILQGIPWGIFQTLTTAYAAEVCPVPLRPILTAYVNLCWVMGQMIASGVLRGLLNNTTEWGYRIPFAIQWIWPVPILIGCLFAPESPWWLIRHGRHDDAKKVLRRLTSPGPNDDFNPDNIVAMMVHTNRLEEELNGGTSFFDCFKGVDLRRTEIACVVWIIQQACGSSLMNYSTFFLENAGLPDVDAFDMSLTLYAIGFIGTVASWFLVPHFGRRTLYIGGLCGLIVCLAVIGFLGFAPSSNTNAQWAVAAVLLVFTFIYDLTIGPVCYCLVAEISSTRLRAKTVVMARFLYNVDGLINQYLTPYMVNPTAWNWGAKTALFWMGICILSVVYCYFRLPEPKGRTYGELDVLFERGVSARKFSSTAVDQYADHDFEEKTDGKAGGKVEAPIHYE